MATRFSFDHTLPFDPADPERALRAIPARPGVFALFGPREEAHPDVLADDAKVNPTLTEPFAPREAEPSAQREAKPYLTRAADLRRRIRRLLHPPEPTAASDASGALNPFSKRLNLRHRVSRIEYTVTGSEFASSLVLYHAAVALYDYPEARRRLKLHTPYFLRFAQANDFPRLYVTNRLSRRSLDCTVGPFASRAAADRTCDAILDLFKLRRCSEDLSPSPEHPGCVYQEMKRCLAPCNQALTPEAKNIYSAESEAVWQFLVTHGQSLMTRIAHDRDAASAAMDFEAAAALHTQHQKAKSAAALADELIQPIPQLRAVIVQPAALPISSSHAPLAEAAVDSTHQPASLPTAANGVDLPAESQTVAQAEPVDPASARASHADEAAVFLLTAGCLAGPEPLSTLGVRAVKEQTSVGSSLFAQPLMLQAVPLASDETAPTQSESNTSLNPEARATALLARLEDGHSAGGTTHDLALLSDHLSLLRRWYYRPEKQRTGEIFFANPDAKWPIRRILRGAARMALGEPAPMAETDREAAKALKAAKNLHPKTAEAGAEAAADASKELSPEAGAPAKTKARTRVLHPGRPGVERVVPIVPRQSSDEPATPGEDQSAAFRTRRTATSDLDEKLDEKL